MHRRIVLTAMMISVGLTAVGCMPQSAYLPTPTKTPAFTSAPAAIPSVASPTVTMPLTHTATSTPAPPTPPQPSTETPSPTTTTTLTPAQSSSALSSDHYWLLRPIPEGYRDYADRTYAYGMTAGGKLRPHTAIDIPNPVGVPVVAAANAVVAYAGTDAETLYGPQPNFYGNLIVLQLTNYTFHERPIYVLYAHLSEVGVTAGQNVSAGEVIGAVGGTGVANGGSHLHFEVRIGDPLSYFTSTRNPDLWIRPYYGYGTLAGRIIDASGAMLREVSITLRGDDMTRYTWTYAGDENVPDEDIQENFTYGDLPEGWYEVVTSSATGRVYRTQVYVEAGKTAWVEFILN